MLKSPSQLSQHFRHGFTSFIQLPVGAVLMRDFHRRMQVNETLGSLQIWVVILVSSYGLCLSGTVLALPCRDKGKSCLGVLWISGAMSGKLTTDVDKRLLRTTKFPPEFNVKVDMTKVNFPVIKRWVQDEIERILGTEDEVVMNTIFNLVEESRYPNIKELQISLNGFLDKDAPKFCHDLWKYCISAQEGPNGVPKELLEAKKKELLQEKVSACVTCNWKQC
ncbi:hypothetical protein B0A54_01688 [Friedmanniomyces endolithicus]|uniref:PWI domain-containing protein n=1 Tax=Friedmanniomyces endolithicus TaxID=329885 RepID=A0A4U0VIP8_9PEZI|nr:hypothetical protein B0A54_01688 [Friedmanniomyces endolithicus]